MGHDEAIAIIMYITATQSISMSNGPSIAARRQTSAPADRAESFVTVAAR
jgi:hypothetical protein